MSDPKPTGVYMLKWLDKQGRGTGGPGYYQYDLPKDGKPRKWHSITNKKRIQVCWNGFHCTTRRKYRNFECFGPRLFIVEVAGSYDCHSDGNKVAFKHIRIVQELPINNKSFAINYSELNGSTARSLFYKVLRVIPEGATHGIVGRGNL